MVHECINLHIQDFGITAITGNKHQIFVGFFIRPDDPTFAAAKYPTPMPPCM